LTQQLGTDEVSHRVTDEAARSLMRKYDRADGPDDSWENQASQQHEERGEQNGGT
jgi:hypothetical protein